jgi:hypothetical protein
MKALSKGADMRFRFWPFLALLVGILPILGCATIIKGSQQQVAFRSDPDNAKVSVYDADGALVADGRTPITLPLKKGAGYFQAAKYKVVFEADGYTKKEIWLTGSLDAGWYIVGNLFFGEFLGWLIVDPLSGAMWTLNPSAVQGRLDKSLSMAPDGGLHIVLASDVPQNLLALATPVTSSGE